MLAVDYSISAAFRAQGDSITTLKTSIFMNLLNIAGNALLIYGLDLGAAGAAWATLFSRFIAAALLLWIAHDKKRYIHVEKILHYKPDFSIIKAILRIGVPNGIENSMFQLGKVLTISLVSTFGTAQIAANAVGNSLVAFQYSAGSAAGIAMITVVGQCVGAGEKEQAKMYAGKLLKLAYTMMITVSLFTCIFIYPLTGLYDLSPEAKSTAVKLVIAHSITASIMHPMAFCVTNSFRAASDVRYPMIMSIVSMWVFRVGFSYVFGLYLNMGVIGVWCAMFCDWIFRASLYTVRFVRGTWLTKYKPLNIDK
jgi:putative MATE family efflux protein